MTQLNEISQHLDYALLLFLRVSGLLILSPIFGRKQVPNLTKIGFCAVLTVILMMGVPAPQAYPDYNNLLVYILACLRELLFGGAMGFVLTAMFDLTLTAGMMIDYQIGFSMANLYDSTENTQESITGSLLNIMMLLMFFSVDGHLKLIEVLYRTIQAVPIGNVALPAKTALIAADVMSSSFILSIMVAMPVMAAGILMEIALGAVVRIVPQLNMFVVGIPIKTIVGLVVLAMSFAMFADFSKVIFSKTFDYVGAMFSCLEGTG